MATIRTHFRARRSRRLAVPGLRGLRVTAGPAALRLALTGYSRCASGDRCTRPCPPLTGAPSDEVRGRTTGGENVGLALLIYRCDRLRR